MINYKFLLSCKLIVYNFVNIFLITLKHFIHFVITNQFFLKFLTLVAEEELEKGENEDNFREFHNTSVVVTT